MKKKHLIVSYELEQWINEKLFHIVPMAISIIDRDYNMVYANEVFREKFGDWQGKKCHEAYKRKSDVCIPCVGEDVFGKRGVCHVGEQIGYDKKGRLIRYISHVVPIVDEKGVIHFLLDMTTDVTEVEKIRKERQLLFDQVPCNMLIIDKSFRIKSINQRAYDMFGKIEGKHCYEILKGLKNKCHHCTAGNSLSDGQIHTGYSKVKDKNGNTVHLQLTTMPLNMEDGDVDHVLEMAVDVTYIMELEDELKVARNFRKSMISSSLEGIIAVDKKNAMTIINPTARQLFLLNDNEEVSTEDLEQILPEGFMKEVFSTEEHLRMPETEITDMEGNKIPVHLTGTKLMVDGKYLGMAFWLHDLRKIKNLEAAKLEAERLAAVGQTVAGLAHGVKNLLTGLEGGMYMLNSGIKKGAIERVKTGMEMLTRNINRVSTFVREFLSFSKGRKIEVKVSDPVSIAKEVVDLYTTRANEQGVEIIFEHQGKIDLAPMDYESMHECLTNLVGNAIDACQMSDEDKGCHVWVRLFEQEDKIVFEVVDDGCGMDYNVKKKVFTNFFTTKGLGGTGLGLLMTKKIIQEHGGTIEMESEKGKGSTFRIILARKYLPKIAENPLN